tara:strand:+ start:206 stop:391 length:186 start_codon:yes stop_codon:yes gene_type:complete
LDVEIYYLGICFLAIGFCSWMLSLIEAEYRGNLLLLLISSFPGASGKLKGHSFIKLWKKQG